MKAWAVIGANYGDESKGKHVDYLCAKHGVDLVVRFNGGAQAGHTVVTPDGRRHVFHHFGSGTFLGVPTYLSRFFVCNPILFNREFDELRPKLSVDPVVYVDPTCLVTTPWDMVINQEVERMRGEKRHGSCGVGFNETIERSKQECFELRVVDLHNHDFRNATIARIIKEWLPWRIAELGLNKDKLKSYLDDADYIYSAWCLDAGMFMGRTMAVPPPNKSNRPQSVVFEGAQGLLLDQNYTEGFPHLTRSNTGMANVATLTKEWGVDEMEALYCTRTYLTRHGAGPLPGEVGTFHNDDTNVPHEFQGTLRYAPLDVASLIKRCAEDSSLHRVLMYLAVSHTDQLPMSDALEKYAYYASNGPTRNHITCLDM